MLTFPDWLYGPTAEVRKVVRRQATLILRDRSLSSIFSGNQIDVASRDGFVVLRRGRFSSPDAKRNNFHADLLIRELESRLLRQEAGPQELRRLAEVVRSGLAHPWWFVGLLDSQAYYIVERAADQLEFLEYARSHWPSLLASGVRYFPYPVEEMPTLVNSCLAKQGAPLPVGAFPEPLTVSRLQQLLDALPGRTVRIHAEQGNLELAASALEGHDPSATVSLAQHLVEAGYTTFARETVRRLKLEDPHGIVLRWLQGLTNVGPGPSNEHRAPPDSRDIAEIEALCHGGTWDARPWRLLREYRGDHAVATVLAALDQRQAWEHLLGVYVHALRDMANAAKILLAHNETGSALAWAHDLVVHELKTTDPPLAAALLFQEAEMGLSFATDDVYRASANRLAEARDVLRSEAHAHLWKERMAAFRERHGGTKGLIDTLDSLGL